jgi:hypothetical protein
MYIPMNAPVTARELLQARKQTLKGNIAEAESYIRAANVELREIDAALAAMGASAPAQTQSIDKDAFSHVQGKGIYRQMEAILQTHMPEGVASAEVRRLLNTVFGRDLDAKKNSWYLSTLKANSRSRVFLDGGRWKIEPKTTEAPSQSDLALQVLQ